MPDAHDPGGEGALRWWLLFAGQLVLCYPLVLLAAEPFSLLLSKLGLSGEQPGHIHFAGYQALLCVFLGPVVGWSGARAAPRLRSAGRWVWLPPVSLVLPAIAASLLRPQPVPRLPEFIFATGGKGDFEVYLFTLPACAAVGYSAGMAAVGLSQRLGKVAVVTIIVCALSLCTILTSLLPAFERAKLERWNKVRMVIDPAGLALSSDPALLCARPFNAPGPVLLTSWTQVESLERRACTQGHPVTVDATSNALPLERVRVLTGPHTGAEGWVYSYGLEVPAP